MGKKIGSGGDQTHYAILNTPYSIKIRKTAKPRRGNSRNQRKTLRSHEAQEAIADYEEAQKAFS